MRSVPLRWSDCVAGVKISLTARKAVQNVHISMESPCSYNEFMFIVGHWVILGSFLLVIGVVLARGSAALPGVAGTGDAHAGVAGRGSPGLVSSSLSMAIYMGDGSHL